jgi:hypothetical protein
VVYVIPLPPEESSWVVVKILLGTNMESLLSIPSSLRLIWCNLLRCSSIIKNDLFLPPSEDPPKTIYNELNIESKYPPENSWHIDKEILFRLLHLYRLTIKRAEEIPLHLSFISLENPIKKIYIEPNIESRYPPERSWHTSRKFCTYLKNSHFVMMKYAIWIPLYPSEKLPFKQPYKYRSRKDFFYTSPPSIPLNTHQPPFPL